MNRVSVSILLLGFLFLSFQVKAQYPNFAVYSHAPMELTSYDGKTVMNAFQIHMHKYGTIDLKKDWYISVKVIPYKSQDTNKYFPVEKMYLRTNSLSGSSKPADRFPTIPGLGLKDTPIIPNMEVSLMNPYSNVPLINASDADLEFRLNLDFIALGGAYLNDYKPKSYTKYPMDIEFRLYNEDHIQVGYSVAYGYYVSVSNELSGTPPVENDYSLFLSPDAKDVNIAFAEAKDYIYGKVVSIPEGLRVSSTIYYELKVSSQSLTEYFTSSDSNEPPLPLDVVTVELGGFDAVPISSSPQKLAEGEQTNNGDRRYNIIYRTKPGDERLFNAKEEIYKTTLTYQIVPR